MPHIISQHSEKLHTLLQKIEQRFTVAFEPLAVDETPLHVLSIQNMTQHLDGLLAARRIKDPLKDLPLWAKIWPASFVLGRFLRKLEPEGKHLLEIGAGCGVTGCIASRYGFASVCVSDIVDDALQFAEANILRNGLENTVNVRRIDVTSPKPLERRFDCIAASELLYLEELHRPLLKFILRHLSPQGVAVFCTDVARRKPRFFKLASRDFKIRDHMVGVRSTTPEGEQENRAYAIHILEFS